MADRAMVASEQSELRESRGRERKKRVCKFQNRKLQLTQLMTCHPFSAVGLNG